MTPPPVRAGAAHAVGPFRVRRIDYAAGLRQTPHAHEGASVTLLLSGEIREASGRCEETGSSLSVVVKPPGVRHSDEVGPRGARTLQVAFGAEAAAELDEVEGTPERWRWLHAGRGARPLLELAAALSGGAPPGEDLEGRILEGLAGLRAWPRAGAAGVPPWLVRVREALDDDPFGKRSVRDCARLAGVHPVSLSRAFRREFGLTVTEYRRRVRLRRASSLLTVGESSLSRAAHAAGYADHPHMCREFRSLTGFSPSLLQRLAAG